MYLYPIFIVIAVSLFIGGEFFGMTWMNYLATGLVLGLVSDNLTK